MPQVLARRGYLICLLRPRIGDYFLEQGTYLFLEPPLSSLQTS